jgi:hypothetical protein
MYMRNREGDGDLEGRGREVEKYIWREKNSYFSTASDKFRRVLG